MKKLVGILAAAALMLTGCGGGAEEPTAAPTTPAPTTEEPTPEPTTEPPPPPVWPLTGEAQEALTVNPVVGIKVENTSAARPWFGLAEADIVFVEMVEGGLTRFHAVYNSAFPEVIGPVRSLRPMDAGILGMWDATLFASGGVPAFIGKVRDAVDVRMEDGGDDGFFRSSGRRAPHNLMVDIPSVLDQLPVPESITPMFAFSDAPSTVGGPAAAEISVNYPGASSSWTWDPATGTFLRSDSGTAAVQDDGTRIDATNVIIMSVLTQSTGGVDSAGNAVPETILTGSGELTLFSGGTSTTGSWSKDGDTEPFVLTDSAGNPLTLAPGTTWVELLPSQGSFGVS